MAMIASTHRVAQAAVVQRPRASVRPARAVFVRATPQKSLDAQLKEALEAAERDCGEKGVKSKDCEVAWDQAEEMLAAKSHRKVNSQENSDPLEAYCKDNEDEDECRMHDV